MSEQDNVPPVVVAPPTTGPAPMNLADAKQALEELVSSPGWAIFCAQALRHAGPESMANDLAVAATKTHDMAQLGSLTAARLASAQTVRFLLSLPEELIAQFAGRKR